MIGPHELYAHLGIPDRDRFILRREDVPALPSKEDVQQVVLGRMSEVGLSLNPQEFVGEYLVLEGENGTKKFLYRHTCYTVVPPEDVLRAASQHVDFIAKNGPGMVWFLAEPVHLVSDDGCVMGVMVGNQPCVLLRSFYGHENQASQSPRNYAV